jgi:hypothetical protein
MTLAWDWEKKNSPNRQHTMSKKGSSVKIGRDAKTGEFVPVRVAVKRPSTTTVETIRKGK